MSSDAEQPSLRFEPLRPASRRQRIVAFVFGPIFWLVALSAAAWVVDQGHAIAIGLLVTFALFVISLVALALLHAGRRRQERRYGHGR